MNKLRRVLNVIMGILGGSSFLAMVVLVIWQVFTRYILKHPSTWSEELVSYLFAWMALFGASLTVSERGHMNIPVVVDKMKPGAKKFFALFAEVIIFTFSGFVLVWGGYEITKLGMGQMTSALGVPVGVFYYALPISGVLNMVFSVINIYDISMGNISVLPPDENEAILEDLDEFDKLGEQMKGDQ